MMTSPELSVRHCAAVVIAVALLFAGVAGPVRGQTIDGELRVWHTVDLTFAGPSTNEGAATNPFTDYRLDVEFTGPGGQTLVVPGFFAADGDAGNTGATSGDRWRVRFMPTQAGNWLYRAKFETGSNVATAADFGTGSTSFTGSFHDANGTLDVLASDKAGRDFRAPDRGLLINRGRHYLTFGGSGDPWVKGGPDIPENLLGYYGFDNTASGNTRGPDYGAAVPAAERYLHRYPGHASDWQAGDPDWDRNDGDSATATHAGRNLIGALNHVASTGANSVYFLPMNLGGDGQDTHPFRSASDKTRYDVSKLEQWHAVFQHAQSRGVFLHLVLAETETGNENFFDGGALGNERKLFYRELVARFGSVPGMQFNIGEENDFGSDRRKDFAAFIKSVDPYDHPIANHIKTNVYNTYNDLIGRDDFDMSSFQTNESQDALGKRVEQWRTITADTGKPWVISVDEPQRIDNDATDTNLGYPSIRRRFTWPAYLSGAGGVELYVQEDGGGHGFDQELEDFGDMDLALTELGYALVFLEGLPLLRMEPNDALVTGEDSSFGGAQVLAELGSVYAIYLPDASNDEPGGPPTLDLTGHDNKRFDLRWYNPRTGEFLNGSVTGLVGGGVRSLGLAPDGLGSTTDWAALVTRIPEPATSFMLPQMLLLALKREARN